MNPTHVNVGLMVRMMLFCVNLSRSRLPSLRLATFFLKKFKAYRCEMTRQTLLFMHPPGLNLPGLEARLCQS